MRKKERKIVGWWVAAGVVVIDRLTKFFFLNFSLALINQGVSWSLQPSFLGPNFLLLFNLILNACFLILIICFPRKIGFWLVFAGGLSNLIDRWLYGGVVDFIRLPLVPVFNFADFAICLGVVLLIVDLLKPKRIS